MLRRLGIETPAIVLAFVETCAGIICSCLPVMRTLITTFFSPLISAFMTRYASARVARKVSERSASTGRTVVAHGSQEYMYPLKAGVTNREYIRHDRGQGVGRDEEVEDSAYRVSPMLPLN